MEATESPTKMEVDTNGAGEANKDAEATKPTAASATTPMAETKEVPSSPSAPPSEGAPPAEEASASTPSDVKQETSADGGLVISGKGTIPLNGVDAAASSVSSPPKTVSAGTPTEVEKVPAEKPESPAKASAGNAAEATPPFVSTSTSSVKTTSTSSTKPKPSPTASSVSSKTSKTSSATKVTKSSSSSSAKVSKTATAKSAASTKSLKKGARKKRKTAGLDEPEEKGGALPKAKKAKRKKDEAAAKASAKADKAKKARKQTKKASAGTSGGHPYADHLHALPGLSAAQMAVQEQMRKALEEDQYSANGSIVDTDSDDDDHQYVYKGQSIRLDRVHLMQAAKKCGWYYGDMSGAGLIMKGGKDEDDDDNGEEGILNEDGSTNNASSNNKKKSSRNKKKGRNQYTNRNNNSSSNNNTTGNNSSGFRIDDKPVETGKPKNLSFIDKGADMERDEGSIFGQTTGASNSTWVECDKCKKWRRLRGVVDHSKLPKKWYCSMNRNDPERARCSAPEEEYDAPHTPESAADARTRKHLRVWCRRLQCNEQYESRLPTLTRGKKRSQSLTSKEPLEWVRCCNPSCGKWRSILRIMDAKQNVIDRTSEGEWYCVMNTWDEKMASCAAPQENLPAVGCPPWVLQDEN